MPWIQIDDTLPTHDKIYDLSDELNIDIPQAVGYMVMFWLWVAKNATDGNITQYKPRAIADAVLWRKKPNIMYDALFKVRLIEKRNDNQIFVRNWDKRAEMLIDAVEIQKEKTAQRVRRHRERKKLQQQEQEQDVTISDEKCNVTETVTCNACNPPTTPHHTTPNHIFNNSGGDGVCACEDFSNFNSENVENFTQDLNFLSDNLKELNQYHGITEGIKQETKAITSSLIERYWGRKAVKADYISVFERIRETQCIDGVWSAKLSEEQKFLIEKAFEASQKAGSMHWNYINGVFQRFKSRGIVNEDTYWDYELQHDKDIGKA